MQKGAEPQEQSPYWLDLALSVDPRSIHPEEAAIDLLSAYAHLYLYPVEGNHALYSISEQTAARDHLLRIQGPLWKWLTTTEEKRDRILNGVLQMLFPDEPVRKWQESPAFPQFCTQDKEYCINVASGKIYVSV